MKRVGARGAHQRPTVRKLPIIRRIAGSTNTSKEMYDETGLPGSVKIGVSSSPTVPKPCGLPGCIATSVNSTVPSRPARP